MCLFRREAHCLLEILYLSPPITPSVGFDFLLQHNLKVCNARDSLNFGGAFIINSSNSLRSLVC